MEGPRRLQKPAKTLYVVLSTIFGFSAKCDFGPSPLGPLGNTSQPSVQEGSREIGDSKRRRTPPPQMDPQGPQMHSKPGFPFWSKLALVRRELFGEPPRPDRGDLRDST